MTTVLKSKYHSGFLTAFLCIVITLTNLSQMPMFVDEGITQYLSIPVWGLLFVYCILTHRTPKFQAFGWLWLYLIIFGVIYSIAIAIDPTYLRAALPSVLLIAMFIMTCSSSCALGMTEKDLSRIFTAYILSVAVVSISVYNEYIAGTSMTSLSFSYLYDSKNSTSQILLSAWLLILFTKLQSKFIVKTFYILLMIFLTYEILMLQSRATIIGMPIALIMALKSSRRQNKRSVQWIAAAFIFALIFAMLDQSTWEILRDKIIFGGRNANSINSLSSGRANEWTEFPALFEEHPFFGYGRLKKESVILTALLEFGMFGGIPLLIIALYPLKFALSILKRYRNNNIFQLFTVVAITYTLNGVFEQLAPFGPGAKCYFLWFLFGILATQHHIVKSHATH